MNGDPTDAPELVRVPVSTLTDFRALLEASVELRRTIDGLHAEHRGLSDQVKDLRAAVAELKPAAEAHSRYLAALADEEQTAAARAVAERRTADESSARDQARLKAWGWRGVYGVLMVGALFAKDCYHVTIAPDRATPSVEASP